MSCTCPKGGELYAIIRENIKNSGFHIQYVYPSKDTGAFFYTIGLSEMGFPELFMGVNARPETGARIIHDIVHCMKLRGVFYGRSNDILDNMPIEVAVIDSDAAIDSHMFQLEEYYSSRAFNIAQILLPDENGLLPQDFGYNMPQIMMKVPESDKYH